MMNGYEDDGGGGGGGGGHGCQLLLADPTIRAAGLDDSTIEQTSCKNSSLHDATVMLCC